MAELASDMIDSRVYVSGCAALLVWNAYQIVDAYHNPVFFVSAVATFLITMFLGGFSLINPGASFRPWWLLLCVIPGAILAFGVALDFVHISSKAPGAGSPYLGDDPEVVALQQYKDVVFSHHASLVALPVLWLISWLVHLLSKRQN